MKKPKSTRGQALIIIVFAVIGLIAMVGVAVDGGNVFSVRRQAQSASDDGALAAALAIVSGQDQTAAVHSITRGYGNAFPDSSVTITTKYQPKNYGQPFTPLEHLFIGNPFLDCNGNSINITHVVTAQDPTDMGSYYVQVMIRSKTSTYFGEVIGVNELNYCVQAIARSRPFQLVPPFLGNAVVGLDPVPGNLSYNDLSNSTYWDITGGGVFANASAEDTHSNVTFHPDGVCATAVGTATGFNCAASENNPQLLYPYPSDPCSVNPTSFMCQIMPRIPACDGTATIDASGTIHPEAGADGSVWAGGFAGNYAPGLYCITDAGGEIHDPITGVGVTFYIEDSDFTLKFNGNGYIGASAPTSGEYKGLLMFSGFTATPCTQNVQIRGNGSTPIIGTILMPSACIDYRGNGTGDLTNSQIVGYDVTSNGTGTVALSYSSEDNYQFPEPPHMELIK